MYSKFLKVVIYKFYLKRVVDKKKYIWFCLYLGFYSFFKVQCYDVL